MIYIDKIKKYIMCIDKRKILIKLLYIMSIIGILEFSTYSYASAAYPKLVKTLMSAFDDIKDWMIALATPAAAISIATGLFMKKFSFGDDEKIRTGKKLIRTAIISYGFILLLDLILTTIANLLTD